MPLKPIFALVLDDNAHMRAIIRVILAQFGCRRIEEAAECAEAVEIVRRGHIDMAFVDFKLGVSGGIDFCKRIRMQPLSPNASLPIIMISGYCERSHVLSAVDAGVDEFLAKPVRAVDVANRINAIINHRRPFIRSALYFGPDRRRREDPRWNGPWRRAADPALIDT